MCYERALAGQPRIWDKNSAERLVNYCVLRTSAAKLSYGEDHSYTSDPVVIRAVSPHGHIIIDSRITTRPSILSPGWNDGNWTRVPDRLCDHIGNYESVVRERECVIKCTAKGLYPRSIARIMNCMSEKNTE